MQCSIYFFILHLLLQFSVLRGRPEGRPLPPLQYIR